MATTRMQPESSADVVGLANLFLGKNSSQTGGSTSQNSGGISTSGTVTTSEGVSPEAVNAVVKSILEGNQGLAAVSSGQKRAGLYNSTTNQMLTNDLIARAAAEGAKLNKTSTQTTNNVQSDNRSTVGTTAQVNNTKAQVNPGKAAGALGLLQLTNLIPKDMKASVLDKIGLGGKKVTGTGTAASTAPAAKASSGVSQAIDDAQAEANAPTYANNPSAFVAGMDPSQAGVGAIGTSMDSQSIESFLSTPDLAGFENGSDGIDIGNFGSAVDVGFDSNSVGGSLGDIGSGIDTSNIGYDPSFDFEGFDAEFGDFDLGFAEGGLVNIRKYGSPNPAAEAAFNSGGDDKSEDKPVQKTAAKEEDKTGRKSIAVKLFDYINNRGGKVPGYAEGGLVKLTHDSRGRKNQYADPRSRTYIPEFGDLEKSPGYATGGMVDLTNLGLRKSGPQYSSPLGVSSNTQSVSGMKSQEDKQSQSPVSGTRSTNATSPVKLNVNRTRASTPSTDIHGSGDASGPGAGTTPGASNSGLGMSPGVASAAGIGLSAIGVPGAVTGLANASNNTQAVNSVVSSVATALAGPVAGLVVNALLSNVTNPDSLDNAAATASANNSTPSNSDTAAAVANSISVDDNMDPLDALVGLINSDSVSTTGSGNVSGVTDSEGFGVGDSSGSSVGADGDGGVGAGGAFKQGGAVDGPGTATSDSIMARLSDGEFVHKASAVKTFGEPFMEAVNDEDPVKALELLLTSGLIKRGRK